MEEKESKPNIKIKIIALAIVIIIITSLTYGYYLSSTKQSQEPKWIKVDFQQPDFILDNLTKGPVFMIYRQMHLGHRNYSPLIDDLGDEYGSRIQIMEIIWLVSSEEEYKSYYLYDHLGTPNNSSGLPLFVIIIKLYNATDNAYDYYFMSLYNYVELADVSSDYRPTWYLDKFEELKETVEQAIGYHNGTVPPPEV